MEGDEVPLRLLEVESDRERDLEMETEAMHMQGGGMRFSGGELSEELLWTVDLGSPGLISHLKGMLPGVLKGYSSIAL